jgi:hypothetical protein
MAKRKAGRKPKAEKTPISTVVKDINEYISVTSILNIDFEQISTAFQKHILNEETYYHYNGYQGEEIYDPEELSLKATSSAEVSDELKWVTGLCKQHHCKYFRIIYFLN